MAISCAFVISLSPLCCGKETFFRFGQSGRFECPDRLGELIEADSTGQALERVSEHPKLIKVAFFARNAHGVYACAEAIDKAAVKCKHCGEFLQDGAAPKKSGNTAVIVIVLAVVIGGFCLIFPIIAAIAIPNLIEARKNGNETSAIGAL